MRPERAAKVCLPSCDYEEAETILLIERRGIQYVKSKIIDRLLSDDVERHRRQMEVKNA